jgi:hypothetical protein
MLVVTVFMNGKWLGVLSNVLCSTIFHMPAL